VRGPLWLFLVSAGAGSGDHPNKCLLKGAFFCQLEFGILEGSLDSPLLPSGGVMARQADKEGLRSQAFENKSACSSECCMCICGIIFSF